MAKEKFDVSFFDLTSKKVSNQPSHKVVKNNFKTPQSISESMKMFRAEYDFVTVMSIDDYMFGGLPHMEVSVK